MTTEAISPDLKAVLRRLKLSPILDTLPERLTLARQQKIPFQDVFLLVLQDEVSRRDARAAVNRADKARLEPLCLLEAWGDTAKVTFDHTLLNELATLRFLPLVFEVASRVMEAQRVRGLTYTTFRERINNFKYLLVPLFINTLRQSRTLGLAVESKGFGARNWKEFYRDFTMKPFDWVILAALVVFVIFVVYLRFGLDLGWTAIYRP